MKLLKFDTNNREEYYCLQKIYLKKCRYELGKRDITQGITIYLFSIKSKLLKRDIIIGRSIVVNLQFVKDDKLRQLYKSLNYIPVNSTYDDTIIEDFYLYRKYRGKNYGSYFVKLVLEDLCGRKIALNAVDDGKWFWKKYGFEYDSTDSYMLLDNVIK